MKGIQELKRLGIFDRLAKFGADYSYFSTSTPSYLPWNRFVLRIFEYALQGVNPSIVLPYWDWTLDSQAPEDSVVFKLMGGNGAGDKQCVADGPYRSWELPFPLRHCLRRQFNGPYNKILSFWSPESIALLINADITYQEFNSRIEAGPSGSVEQAIGGEMATPFNQHDPLWYLHRAYIDKIWVDYQAKFPEKKYEYNGVNFIGGNNAHVSDRMMPFGVRVDSVMDNKGPGMCYKYSDTPSAHINLDNPDLESYGLPDLTGKINDREAYATLLNGVAPSDREDQSSLRVPFAVSRRFIDFNRFNYTEVRRLEVLNSVFVNQLNSQGYQSIVNLANRQDTWNNCAALGSKYGTTYGNQNAKPDHTLPTCDTTAPFCAFYPLMEQALKERKSIAEIEDASPVLNVVKNPNIRAKGSLPSSGRGGGISDTKGMVFKDGKWVRQDGTVYTQVRRKGGAGSAGQWRFVGGRWVKRESGSNVQITKRVKGSHSGHGRRKVIKVTRVIRRADDEQYE
ncbi:hypothetical protein K7432_010866 [Basidiobolus ranarum]|uniref:Tyrosinase copper-binding domain-containing protein n=1 Tax=Basidiobolus ranarum TaxID=34480 RepID=A0ABR2VUU4_9FUNG